MSKTLVTFLLDRTGSMSACKQATIEAFNGYVDGLRSGDDAPAIEFTFLQFDSMSLDKIHVAEDIKAVQLLNDSTYQPRASTPLIDAAYKTIKAVEESLTKRDDKPKVVVCIQTDGQENASTEYTMADLNALIKEKTAQGWQFNFMGAGIDAYATAGQMGVPMAASVSYNKNDRMATSSSFRAAASNTRAFAAGSRSDVNFSARQRLSSGDVHAKNYGLDPHAQASQAPDLTKPVVTRTSQVKSRAAKIVDDVKL
jgi:hypothetical protein